MAFVSLGPMLAFHGRPVLQKAASRCSVSLVSAPRASLIDPHFVHHATSFDWHAAALFLSDGASAATAAISGAAADASSAAASLGDASKEVAGAAADAAVAAKKGGLWDAFVGVIEGSLQILHANLVAAGVPGAYGLSIIFFTVAVKALTFPLNKKQMESTMRMQALAPRLKAIQNEYKDNPTVMNQLTAKLYRDENINPLAGCLPVFLQIPIWIALYRSLLRLAKEDLLNEPFLWLPSLQGPVSETGKGLDTWLFPLQNGAPPIGWHDALCYLVIPVILVASQAYSQKLLQPPSQDSQSQQANAFLKFMPLLIGWFSLNVPSGLGIYWVTNNLVSTAQTLYIRSNFANETATDVSLTSSNNASSVPQPRTLEQADGFRSNGTGETTAPRGSSKSSRSGKAKRRKRR